MSKRYDIEGKLEKFKKDWYEDRKNKYEPKFIECFNKKFEKGEINVSKNLEAKYSLDIKTTWIYPGYFAEPAKISATMTFMETTNSKKFLVFIAFEKAIGFEYRDFNRDQGDRIAGAYEKLAKNITIQLKRFL